MTNDVAVHETDCNRRRKVLRSGVSCGIAVNGLFQSFLRDALHPVPGRCYLPSHGRRAAEPLTAGAR
jgi:hypothetical protein